MKHRLLATLVITLAACSGGGESGKAKGGLAATTVVTPSSTTSSVTTLVSQTTTAASNPLAKGPPYRRDSGPSGSGCSPPDAASLPDGWWAGRIKNPSGVEFDFDLVCWFSGQAAIKAGGEDDQGPVEDDYYVRNTDGKLYRAAFASPGAPATCVGDSNQPFECTVGDVVGLYGSGSTSVTIGGKQVTAFSTVWLHVTGGQADYLYMQFTP